jgi:hypothetical protein
VEKVEVNTKYKNFANLIVSLFIISACVSKELNYDKVGPLKKIDEFENKVTIVTQPEEKARISSPPEKTPPLGSAAKEEKPKKLTKIKKQKHAKVPLVIDTRHQPEEIEGQEGFIGRRPIVDPFKVGERVMHNVTFLGLTAGTLTMETKPFADVNGKKSYQFQTSIATRSIFASIYTVDDNSVSLLDFDTLVPSVFTVHIKESKQYKEARAFFDRQKGLATYWERRVTAEDGEKEKKLEWEIPDYSQNVFSSFYYIRAFPWKLGSEHAFRVADDGKNLVFSAKCIRKEKIQTDAGEFNALVIKPQVQLRGIAQTMGDIYMWISDDDRKFLLKLEAKIKIGYLKSEVVEIDPGHD